MASLLGGPNDACLLLFTLSVPSHNVSGFVCATNRSSKNEACLPRQGHRGHLASSSLSGSPTVGVTAMLGEHGSSPVERPMCWEPRSPVHSKVRELGNLPQSQASPLMTVRMADTSENSRRTGNESHLEHAPKFLIINGVLIH